MSRKTPTMRQAVPSLLQLARHVKSHLAAQKLLLALGMLFLLLEVGLRLLEPWPLAFVLDELARAAGANYTGTGTGMTLTTLLLVAGGVLLLVVVGRAAASYGMTVMFALAGNRVLTRVRSELYDHLNSLSMRFHHSRRTGDLVTRLTGDVGRMQDAVVTAMLPLIGNIVTLAGMLVVIFIMDWQLALVAVVVLPAFLLLGKRSTRKIAGVARQQRKAEGGLASLSTETLGAMPVVHAYQLQGRLHDRFAKGNNRALKDGVKAKRLSAGLERATDVLVGLATAIVLVAGAHRVLNGHLTLGELTVFLTYLKTAFRPLRDVAKYTGRISKAAASGERIVDLLDEIPEITDSRYSREAPRLRGYVEFQDVRFGYSADRPVLKGINLQILAGQRVAVVGTSGAGKSSLSNLLLRLHDPDVGSVRVDGHDLRDLTLNSVRNQIAVVLQDSPLFAESIAANIALGTTREVTQEQIERAAQIAGAHEFISALPDGYDTVLSDRGTGLSGGQRQRIAIARAAIRDAPIVILDEALTGLDPATQTEVTEALYRLTEGRTTLIITHDPETAADADRVVRMEHGRVVSDGPPTGLITGAA
ncbi:MAG: ABC transporter ATP-binding protein [Galactobacter sp.]|uniref:ABC transporter ATP-binding protein n=1 Tax=Galactobacter sp. TaxID=2676125 RepID=UPI0025BA5F3C|nr:ABC transporter ATP-binding protein [Galactobacter sp.]